jgi:hypothetical protein
MEQPTILIGLSISSIISNNDEIRINQYIKGLTILFKYLDEYKIKSDIYITDNTCDKLDLRIQNILPAKCIKMCSINNKGKINKGVGLVHQWLECKDIIQKYKWFIHFEPRLRLNSFSFFTQFIDNPANTFHFIAPGWVFTGLFAVESKILLSFCNNINIQHMSDNFISIEHVFSNYIKKYKYKYYTSLEVTRFNYNGGEMNLQ